MPADTAPASRPRPLATGRPGPRRLSITSDISVTRNSQNSGRSFRDVFPHTTEHEKKKSLISSQICFQEIPMTTRNIEYETLESKAATPGNSETRMMGKWMWGVQGRKGQDKAGRAPRTPTLHICAIFVILYGSHERADATTCVAGEYEDGNSACVRCPAGKFHPFQASDCALSSCPIVHGARDVWLQGRLIWCSLFHFLVVRQVRT